MRTIQQDAIAEWHRQTDACADELTREANQRKGTMAKKKPTDLTLRNARASQARDAILLARLKKLEARVKELELSR